MVVVFYIVNMYVLCIYDLLRILLSMTHLWFYGMYVHVYVCYVNRPSL